MADPLGAVAAARDLLPWWARFADVLWLVPGALALGSASTWAGTRFASGPLRRSGDPHWVERARLSYPALAVAALFSVLPAAALAMLAWQPTGWIAATPRPLLVAAVFAAAYVGSFAVRRRLARQLRAERAPWPRALHREVVTVLLLAPHLVVLVPMLLLLEGRLDAPGAAVLGLGALGFLGLGWWGGLPLARALGGLGDAPDRLARAVAAAAERVGIAPAAVHVVDASIANAIAFPSSRSLAFTERALDALSDEELAAVAAHELGHLSEPRAVRLARAAGPLALLPVGAWSPVVGGLGFAGLAVLLAVSIAWVLGLGRLARRMEVRADAIARGCEGDAGAYARALERIYRANLLPVVMPGRRRVHPHLYDRMLAAGVQPAYRRPAPPSRARSRGGAALASSVLLLGVCGLHLLPRMAPLLLPERDAARLWSLAVAGSDAEDLLDQALLSESDGEAVVYLRAAAQLDPTDHEALAYLAELLSLDGRCGEAAAALAAAEERTRAAPEGSGPWLADARSALESCLVLDGAS